MQEHSITKTMNQLQIPSSPSIHTQTPPKWRRTFQTDFCFNRGHRSLSRKLKQVQRSLLPAVNEQHHSSYLSNDCADGLERNKLNTTFAFHLQKRMPASKQKLGCLPSPVLHTSTASTRDHQQLSRRCQHSSARAATAHLRKDLVVSSPTSCWQQPGATSSQKIHSRGSYLWLGAFFHLPHWVAEVQKGFYPKCLKLTWTHTSSPDSTDVTQIQCGYSSFVGWLLKGYQPKVMTSLIRLSHLLMV